MEVIHNTESSNSSYVVSDSFEPIISFCEDADQFYYIDSSHQIIRYGGKGLYDYPDNTLKILENEERKIIKICDMIKDMDKSKDKLSSMIYRISVGVDVDLS